MRKLRHVKSLGFFFWHSRHMLYHVLLGLVWAWFLREYWNEFNFRYVIFALLGSLLPDADHFLYWFTYGRNDEYTQEIKYFLKARQWRNLTVFIENGHKQNTNLTYHNLYFILLLAVTTVVSLLFDWKSWVVITGAMLIHFLFDIGDDMVNLGYLNPNWKRWGRSKRHKT